MVAGPELSILDIMSSPDPLNESDANTLYSSARRVTRSQVSQRIRSVESSPKKQTFALDVGNEISPQKILVTVQTEDADMMSARGVKRRLFQSPTPKRSTRKKTAAAGATTTTVPLRGLTDDEGDATATPKARGRPRKPGTPAPTTTRRKKGTPLAQRVLSQAARTTRSSSVLASDMSEADNQETPKPTKTKRAPKRKASSPVKEDSVPSSQPRKRGRPRKTAVASSDIRALSEQESAADGEVEDNISVAQTEDNISVAGSRADVAPSEGEEDIWMATLSDQPTPVARRNARMNTSINIPDTISEAAVEAPERQQSEAALSEVDFIGGDDGYADFGGMGSQSDAESLTGDNQDPQERQDTVAAGEDFTMINVHSLSSMIQLNSSVMTGAPPQAQEEEPQSELGHEASLIVQDVLESLRQSQRANQAVQEEEARVEADRSFAGHDRPSFGSSVMQQPTHLSSQAPSPQASSRSPQRSAKKQSLGKQLAMKSLQEAIATSPERPAPVSIPEAHDTSAYDDSFSEIPEEVLTAATPRRLRPAQAEIEEDTPKPDIQPSIERPSTVNHSNPQSESNRLLTPDETPSPVLSEDGNHEKEKTSPLAAPEPEMNSSPPIPSAHTQSVLRGSIIRHARTHSTETPAEQLSDFNSPARGVLNAHTVNLPPPETQPRPILSPIVRAGRALQLVTSDPPSPPGRGSVLRSPFRGSVPKSSQSPVQATMRTTQSPPQALPQAPAKQPERSWMSPLNRVRDFVVQGAQALSPRLGSVSRMEDPFGPDPSEPPRPPSAGSFLASLGRKGSVARLTAPSVASSTRAATVHDEDGMSWQGEDSPPRERSASRESSIHAAHGSPAREGGAGAYQDEEVDDVEEEEEEYDDQHGEESKAGPAEQEMEDQVSEQDDEEDIWAVEAQRPTPGKPAQPRREPVVEPPRRSKIPSPWRRNSKRLVYSDELHRLSEDNAPQSEADEMSMLSQQNRSKPEVAPQKLAPPKNVDLSEFFSSPAALPDAQDAGFGLFKALDAPSLEQGTGFGRSVRGQPPSNSTSLTKQPFAASRVSQPPQSVRQKVPQMFQLGRNLLDVNNAFTSAPPATNPLAQSSSPGTPDRVKFAHVPQKTNFTPRSRKAGNNLFHPPASKSLFGGGNPVPVFSVEAPEDDQDEQDISVVDDSSFIQPQLKPLPSRAMSPSKSSFRSPLKPKTPGRVVEFTSSTLSPFAQAQVRAERRASASPEKQLSPVSSHSSSISIEDKENQQSESELEEPEQQSIPTSISASASMRAPPPQRRPVLAPPTSFSNIIANANARPPSPTKNQKLSRTEWTRDHWVRLDQLLQARRQGVLQFQLQLAHAPSSSLAGKKRSPEGQRLIGKKVSSQGEEMLLEEWHIDIVDAFCAEVGGWEADDIARRLFAAMVGEERRRLGLIPKRR
ncbi:hypothetical protein QBC34DRAFT_389943 [Podospora aff. communis PSN243]|uniref:Structure-specific endonuclease subunit SLX4 n=1 Tax=Podospora aff. communis PSN243 TaxID=3040156 RepID=A0AAV9H594_9PEZI|nr:hypothetical protein QBC34DRAFT_389943 [Podospora aff. communis PSN243]